MPLIRPPDEYGEPKPKEQSEPILTDWEDDRRIQLFLNVKSWKCPKCGMTNFGRNKACVPPCRFPRPAHYIKSRGLEP